MHTLGLHRSDAFVFFFPCSPPSLTDTTERKTNHHLIFSHLFPFATNPSDSVGISSADKLNLFYPSISVYRNSCRGRREKKKRKTKDDAFASDRGVYPPYEQSILNPFHFRYVIISFS